MWPRRSRFWRGRNPVALRAERCGCVAKIWWAHSEWFIPTGTTPASSKSWAANPQAWFLRSEEHTSELQSRGHLVCRLLLEKKNIKKDYSKLRTAHNRAS